MNKRKKIKDINFGIRYNYRVTRADISSKEAKDLYDKIEWLFSNGFSEKASELLNKLNKTFGEVVALDHNIVPNTGLTVLAKAISGNATGLDALEIKYGAVGTGTGTAVLGDTTLGTEQFRKVDSSLTYKENKAYVTMLYSATDFTTTGIGNIKEHGLFIDGTTGADSGSLWSRLLLNSPTGISKTNLQSLTIDYEVEFKNA